MKQFLVGMFKEGFRDRESRIILCGIFGGLFILFFLFLIILMLGGMTFFQALSLIGLMYGLTFAFGGLYFWILMRIGAVELEDKKEPLEKRRGKC